MILTVPFCETKDKLLEMKALAAAPDEAHVVQMADALGRSKPAIPHRGIERLKVKRQSEWSEDDMRTVFEMRVLVREGWSAAANHGVSVKREIIAHRLLRHGDVKERKIRDQKYAWRQVTTMSSSRPRMALFSASD